MSHSGHLKYICLDYHPRTIAPVGITPLACRLQIFSCGEYQFVLNEDILGHDILLLQGFSSGQFNDSLVRLQVVCDALKANGVGKITYFAPFLPYTRDDKSECPSSSLGVRLIGRLLNSCGIDKVITYDLHSSGILDFFHGEVVALSMIPSFVADMQGMFDPRDAVIVWPDSGALVRALGLPTDLPGFNLTLTGLCSTSISKQRLSDGSIEMQLLGPVDGRIAILIDDIVDSGSTLIRAAGIVLDQGARDVFAYATHGIFSNDAMIRIAKSPISGIVVSDSISVAIPQDSSSIGIAPANSLFRVLPIPFPLF